MSTVVVPSVVRAPGRLPVVAAAAVTTAGALHLVAALGHLAHDVRYAVFFLGVGLAQACLGPRLRGGTGPASGLAAVAATVALVVLYALSRTLVLVDGPHADRPEDPDAVGTAVVVCELVAVAAIAALLPPRWRAVAVNGVLAAGLGMWVLWASGVLA